MTAPRFTDPRHHEQLLDAARHLLAERERRYPALIQRDVMTAADAARRLELARCLVVQWSWVADPLRASLGEWQEPGWFNAWAHELEADIAEGAARQRQFAERDGGERATLIADLYAALAWWQVRDGSIWGCRIVRYADFTAGFASMARAVAAAGHREAA